MSEFLTALRDLYAKYPVESKEYEGDYEMLVKRLEESNAFLSEAVALANARAAEIERMSERNSSLLATNYDLYKLRDRLVDEVAYAKKLLSALRNEVHVADIGDHALVDRIDAFLAAETVSEVEK